MCGVQSRLQGLVFSPFLYSFYTSQADRVLPVCCSMLQYADDLAVYVSHVDVKNIQWTVQSAYAIEPSIFCDVLKNYIQNA
jgi:hypothetical protein